MTLTLNEALKEQFGFDQFKDGQQQVISRLLADKSVLAIFPTGAGKSLCYQLPALMLDGVTLVVSPLIALMKDQIDFLQSKGIRAARLDSSLELTEYRQVMNDLTANQLKLLYIAPERLASERFLQTLKRLHISLLAIDEAHCISEWGHNFRPDYMKLATLAQTLNVPRVLALTATAPPTVAEQIAQAFNIANDDIIKTPFHRKNLTLRITPVPRAGEREAPSEPSSIPPSPGTPGEGRGEGLNSKRNNLLLARIQSLPPGPTIVYVTLQKTAEDLAAFLAENGLPARPYHAGLDAEERHAIQDQFMQSDRAIVVATIAFGMGIDKKDIRYVYHYNLPKTLENYAQEIGRAGRDGLPSVCELLADPADQIPLQNFTYGDTPTPRAIHALLQSLFNPQSQIRNPQFDISTYELSGAYDIRPLVIETILTYLELEGLIASTGPFYNEYKFQPLRPSQQMLARFDPPRQEFLRAILKCARPLKTWFKLDLAQVTQATNSDRARVIAALNYLEEQGDLKLEVAGARQGYRRLKDDVDIASLTQTLVTRFANREERDIQRLQSVLDFANTGTCRTQYLLEYFGESLTQSTAPDSGAKCGHCDHCLGASPAPLQPLTPRPLSDSELQAISDLKSHPHPALATPRQLARFLCGLNSPATTRAKLKTNPAFALLVDIPFPRVLQALRPTNNGGQ